MLPILEDTVCCNSFIQLSIQLVILVLSKATFLILATILLITECMLDTVLITPIHNLHLSLTISHELFPFPRGGR